MRPRTLRVCPGPVASGRSDERNGEEGRMSRGADRGRTGRMEGAGMEGAYVNGRRE